MEEDNYVCGDTVDILRVFATNERLHCSDDIETVFYSSLTDSKISDHLICYSCGDNVPDECFKKYIDEKAIHSQVFPTCTLEKCAKNERKKCSADLWICLLRNSWRDCRKVYRADVDNPRLRMTKVGQSKLFKTMARRLDIFPHLQFFLCFSSKNWEILHIYGQIPEISFFEEKESKNWKWGKVANLRAIVLNNILWPTLTILNLGLSTSAL